MSKPDQQEHTLLGEFLFSSFINLIFFNVSHRVSRPAFYFVHAACGILVSQPGMEAAPLALAAWSLNHWTTKEVPLCAILILMLMHLFVLYLPSVQFSSVAQSCPTLQPHDRSTPGLPVHHQLPEFTQTHAHQVGDAIQPSHPLLSPSAPAPNPSKHQGLF